MTASTAAPITTATAPTATPTRTTTSTLRVYSASNLVLPHDTDDGMAPSLCDDSASRLSFDAGSIMHLHRATPDNGKAPNDGKGPEDGTVYEDGTAWPSCYADVIVPLHPNDSTAPSDAATPHNAAPSYAASPCSVASRDATPPRNAAPSDAAPPYRVAPSDTAPPRSVAPCEAVPTCDIAKPRRSKEQGEEDMETPDVGKKVGSGRQRLEELVYNQSMCRYLESHATNCL